MAVKKIPEAEQRVVYSIDSGTLIGYECHSQFIQSLRTAMIRSLLLGDIISRPLALRYTVRHLDPHS